MTSRFKKISKKILIVSMLVLVLLQIQPMRARAALPVLLDLDVSFTSIQRTINSIYGYLKDFVLDHLAVAIAQQIIQQMTSSIINWINTGFNGSPTFLTNPEGFFMDVGDQVTGAMIAGNGPLSSLCSPFSLDIRLALASYQAQTANNRYKCTLQTVINNAKNARANVSVVSSPNGANIQDLASGDFLHNSNQLSVNGQSAYGSANAFVNGDFSQGGLPAFVSLTTEQQNSPYGAWIQARSDAATAIAIKEAATQNDITAGHGFLSWKDCKTVPAGQIYYNTDIGTEMQSAGEKGFDETCTVNTPGSVISGSLMKQLGAPTDKLNLVKSINDIIDAALNQMVTMLVTKGLSSLSQGSGGHRSYANQLSVDASSNNSAVATEAQSRTAKNIKMSVKPLEDNKKAYDSAVQVVTDSQDSYQAARSCFVDKLSSYYNLNSVQISFAQGKIAGIDAALQNKVSPLLADLTPKQAKAADDLAKAQGASDTSGLSPQQLLDQTNTYAHSTVGSGATVDGSKKDQADQDLQDAKDQSKKFDKDAKTYQTACNQFPGTYQ